MGLITTPKSEPARAIARAGLFGGSAGRETQAQYCSFFADNYYKTLAIVPS